MLNTITVQGRLTADPELRYTQSGKSVVSFSVACERDYADQNGQRGCDFISVAAWNGTAEFVCKYFFKGSMILLSGRLQQRTYTDKAGQNRSVHEIVASNVWFGESKRSEDRQSDSSGPYRAPSRDSFENARRAQSEGTDWCECDAPDADLPF